MAAVLCTFCVCESVCLFYLLGTSGINFDLVGTSSPNRPDVMSELLLTVKVRLFTMNVVNEMS